VRIAEEPFQAVGIVESLDFIILYPNGHPTPPKSIQSYIRCHRTTLPKSNQTAPPGEIPDQQIDELTTAIAELIAESELAGIIGKLIRGNDIGLTKKNSARTIISGNSDPRK